MLRATERPTMRWFGSDFGAPIYKECPQVPTPVGMWCRRCDERIVAGDDGFLDGGGSIFHRACFLRSIYGSVAHQRGECSCYRSGACADAEDSVSRREEAEAAVRYYETHTVSTRS